MTHREAARRAQIRLQELGIYVPNALVRLICELTMDVISSQTNLAIRVGMTRHRRRSGRVGDERIRELLAERFPQNVSRRKRRHKAEYRSEGEQRTPSAE